MTGPDTSSGGSTGPGRLPAAAETLAFRPVQWMYFRRQIDMSGGPEACWRWLGTPTPDGYGIFGKGSRPAHRVAYEVWVALIPKGMVIDHTCHTRDTECVGGRGCPHRLCVNPAHLEVVTQRENILRSAHTMPHVNARKTHCPKGHPYDEANTIHRITSRGGKGRDCRACQRAYRQSPKQRQLTGAAS